MIKDELYEGPFPCPCCGYLTVSEQPYGTHEICDICFWEDDDVQLMDPDCSGGANRVSLNEARNNFKELGAKSKETLPNVRKPTLKEIAEKNEYEKKQKQHLK